MEMSIFFLERDVTNFIFIQGAHGNKGYSYVDVAPP